MHSFLAPSAPKFAHSIPRRPKIINPYSLAMWLSGYYNGQRGNTIIDTETLAAQTSTLQDFCLHNAKVPVMQAIDKLFHK